jgi:hypothetical protein
LSPADIRAGTEYEELNGEVVDPSPNHECHARNTSRRINDYLRYTSIQAVTLITSYTYYTTFNLMHHIDYLQHKLPSHTKSPAQFSQSAVDEDDAA